jgi:hypothetical protein
MIVLLKCCNLLLIWMTSVPNKGIVPVLNYSSKFYIVLFSIAFCMCYLNQNNQNSLKGPIPITNEKHSKLL